MTPSKIRHRPSGPTRAQSATVNTVAAITTSITPAASSSRAAARADTSGRRGCAAAGVLAGSPPPPARPRSPRTGPNWPLAGSAALPA
ncbi:MAG TPA: hypothetical protein VMU94_31960 [Streptosporangiaceae bacterium]|nr:hypothetical protein [Streptosporangiaceae bacterium]